MQLQIVNGVDYGYQISSNMKKPFRVCFESQASLCEESEDTWIPTVHQLLWSNSNLYSNLDGILISSDLIFNEPLTAEHRSEG